LSDGNGDSSRDEDSDNGGEEVQGNEVKDNVGDNAKNLKFLRKSSLSVIHMKKPRGADLFSPAAFIRRALVSKLAIPPDDPVLKHEYNHIILRDRDFRKKIYAEIKACRSYYHN
jgi:hypothetical protein